VTEVVFAGHGAGAQFVQRYAGIGVIPATIRCDIRIKYVVANPGSYMFPTSDRPRSTSGCDGSNGNLFQDEYIMGVKGVDACPSGTSVITDPNKCIDAAAYVGVEYKSFSSDLAEGETGICVVKNIDKQNIRTTMTHSHGSSAAWLCEGENNVVSTNNPTYDQYKYGISNLPDDLNYASVSVAEIQNNLVHRDVVLLLGTGDNSRDTSPIPDKSCEADAQGLHRYERGLNYKDNVKALDCSARTTVIKVPDVGHYHNQMFTSPQGIMALFIG